jgi:hypothetical protein
VVRFLGRRVVQIRYRDLEVRVLGCRVGEIPGRKV